MTRAKPFSGKQKKAQLQEKRHKKASHDQSSESDLVIVQQPRQKAGKLTSQWDTLGAAKKPGPYENADYVAPIVQLPKVGRPHCTWRSAW